MVLFPDLYKIKYFLADSPFNINIDIVFRVILDYCCVNLSGCYFMGVC
jgi:hypothetical protein